MKQNQRQRSLASFARIGALAAISCLFLSSAHAGSVAGTGGATEVTQLLNNGQLIQIASQSYQQIQQLAQQLQYMQSQLQNLVTAPQQIWGQAQSDLTQLTQLVSQGQALGYALGNIDQAFASKYPGYRSTVGTNFSQAAQDWVRTSLDSFHSAILDAGMQSQQFATEHSAMVTIQSMSAGAPGALQAIQAGNMIANAQVSQLQKLRQLMMAQMQAQEAYMAQHVQQDSDIQAAVSAQMTPYTGTPPSFQSSGGKN